MGPAFTIELRLGVGCCGKFEIAFQNGEAGADTALDRIALSLVLLVYIILI